MYIIGQDVISWHACCHRSLDVRSCSGFISRTLSGNVGQPRHHAQRSTKTLILCRNGSVTPAGSVDIKTCSQMILPIFISEKSQWPSFYVPVPLVKNWCWKVTSINFISLTLELYSSGIVYKLKCLYICAGEPLTLSPSLNALFNVINYHVLHAGIPLINSESSPAWGIKVQYNFNV